MSDDIFDLDFLSLRPKAHTSDKDDKKTQEKSISNVNDILNGLTDEKRAEIDKELGINFDEDEFFNPDYKPAEDEIDKFWKLDEDNADIVIVNAQAVSGVRSNSIEENSNIDVESVRLALVTQQKEEEMYIKKVSERKIQELVDEEMAKKLQREEFEQQYHDPYTTTSRSRLSNRRSMNYPYKSSIKTIRSSLTRSNSRRDSIDEPNQYERGSFDVESNFTSNLKSELLDKSESRVVLSSKEIKQMAEEVLGKENIKLLAGFTVTKFGREGRPHQRKFWVNSSLTHLAWDSKAKDGRLQRGLDFSTVSDIKVGEKTKNISRATNDYERIQLCFSLITNERTVDLQACSILQRNALVEALRKVLTFNHKHRPVRKMKNRVEVSIFTDK